MNKLMLLFFSFALVSCVTNPEFKVSKLPQQEAKTSTNEEIMLLKSAQSDLPNSPDSALGKLNKIAVKPTNSQTYFESMIFMGRILEQKNRDTEALRAYERVIDSDYNHPKRVFAFFRVASIYKDKGNLEKAIYFTKSGLAQPTISTQDKLIFYKFAYPLYISNESFVDALYATDYIFKNTQDRKFKNEVREISRNIIQVRLNRKQLQEVIEKDDLVEYHGDAYAKLGEIYFYSGDPVAATEQFNNALNLLPSGQLRQRIAEMTRYSSIFKDVEKNAIGVVLPLSGPKKIIGENVLRGLKIGMESGSGNYKLIVKDSQANSEIAAQMTNELIKDNGVFGIIGGATSATAESIVAVASRFGVPTLVLTPKPGIVESYDFTFQNALTIKYAAQKTAEYVLSNPNIRRIAVLKPDDNFGDAYAERFMEVVTRNGKEISGVEKYDFSDKKSLNEAIKKLVKLDPEGDRKEEFKKKLNQWKSTHQNARRLTPPSIDELLKAIIEFDALFIADSAKPGALVAATLPYFDVEGVPLIGTHLWNSDELIKRAPEQVEGAVFIDSLPPAHQWPNNFCTRSIAESLNGKEPDMFSVLGYDSAKIFKTALNSSPDHRVALKEKLENLGKVDGCLGDIFLDQSRIINLPIFDLIVKDKKIVINSNSKLN